MLVAAIQTGAFALVGLALLGLFGVLAAVNRRGAGLGWISSRGPSMTRLSPEHAVHVVELDGRRWLVGTGPSSAPAVLAELTSSPPPSPWPSSTSASVSSLHASPAPGPLEETG